MIKIRRLIKSFHYALKGIRKVYQEEQNFRIQVFSGIIVLLTGLYFHITRFDWIILIFIIGLVMLMELANSAVERVADVLKPRINSYVKEIKDIMAAAVMLASLIAVITGLIIFWPYIF